jgi:hypothetical protein
MSITEASMSLSSLYQMGFQLKDLIISIFLKLVDSPQIKNSRTLELYSIIDILMEINATDLHEFSKKKGEAMTSQIQLQLELYFKLCKAVSHNNYSK